MLRRTLAVLAGATLILLSMQAMAQSSQQLYLPIVSGGRGVVSAARTATATKAPTQTSTATLMPTPTNTPTDTATATPSSTVTHTATSTPTNTATATITPTATATKTRRRVLFVGSSITAAETGAGTDDPGYRPLTEHWLPIAYPDEAWEAVSIARPGADTWNNLFWLGAGLTPPPDVVVFDIMNNRNTDLHRGSMEALVRRIWTANPNTRIVAVNFFGVSDRLNDATVLTPTNSVQMQDLRDLADYYGFALVDWYAAVKTQVARGHHLSEYIYDHVHPTGDGHELAFRLLSPAVAAAVALDPQATALPPRLYSGSADYEQTQVTRLGADTDGRTGSWTYNGVGIESSEPGATVTYSGVFRSIGIVRSRSSSPLYEYSLDGGPWRQSTVALNGLEVAAVRGQHTITIRVLSNVRIDYLLMI